MLSYFTTVHGMMNQNQMNPGMGQGMGMNNQAMSSSMTNPQAQMNPQQQQMINQQILQQQGMPSTGGNPMNAVPQMPPGVNPQGLVSPMPNNTPGANGFNNLPNQVRNSGSSLFPSSTIIILALLFK